MFLNNGLLYLYHFIPYFINVSMKPTAGHAQTLYHTTLVITFFGPWGGGGITLSIDLSLLFLSISFQCLHNYLASLHFSGHTFNISSCLNVARNMDGKCISTEIKVYQLYQWGSGGGSPQNFVTKQIHRIAGSCCRFRPHFRHVDVL